MSNKLAQETSPYLLQHAENPVEWYPWGEQALTLAREQNKPILLSIGYSACHCCHVMAHESFEDTETANVMNTHFINIKVDREERPDIDQIYQTAHSMLSQKSGGWPLTVFLTPNQEPFFTGTYFPKTARYQLLGFTDLIPRVAAYYHERKADLAIQNQQLRDALARTIPVANNAVTADESTIELAFQQLRDNFDFENSGFYFTAHHHEQLIHRTKQAYDNATPNGNCIAAVALQRVGHILGEPRYLQSAERTLQAFDNILKRNPAGCASLSYALGEYITPPTLVILRGGAEKLRYWRYEITQQYYPHHLFFYLDETVGALPKTLQRIFSKDVNAWVCKGVVCSPGIDDLSSLLSGI